MTDPIRTALEQVLTDNGIVPNQNGFHGWRCEHPDRYPDYCHCVPELLDDLVAALATPPASPEPDRDDIDWPAPEVTTVPAEWGRTITPPPFDLTDDTPPTPPESAEALRDALVDEMYAEGIDMATFHDRIDAIIAAARATPPLTVERLARALDGLRISGPLGVAFTEAGHREYAAAILAALEQDR